MASKVVTLTYKGTLSSAYLPQIDRTIVRGGQIECAESIAQSFVKSDPNEWEIVDTSKKQSKEVTDDGPVRRDRS